MRNPSRGAAVVSLAFVAALLAHANEARAAGTRIAVAPVENRATLTLRLAAELAEIGYAVVPISTDDTTDGAVLTRALFRDDAVAALVIEESKSETLACVIERLDARRTCRGVAGKKDEAEDAAIATRSAELLRALIPTEPPATKSSEKMAPASTSTTGAVVETDAREEDVSVGPGDAGFEARFGPGVMLPNGAPAELSFGVGADWIATPHFVLGLDAMVPLTAGTIDRSQGSASVRATSIAGRADARFATGHWETAIGAGMGLLWLQVTGTSIASSQGIDESFADPFAMIHGELSAFVTRAVAVRLDLTGGYVLSRAAILFAGQEVARVGQPLAMSTLSLAVAWQ